MQAPTGNNSNNNSTEDVDTRLLEEALEEVFLEGKEAKHDEHSISHKAAAPSQASSGPGGCKAPALVAELKMALKEALEDRHSNDAGMPPPPRLRNALDAAKIKAFYHEAEGLQELLYVLENPLTPMTCRYAALPALFLLSRNCHDYLDFSTMELDILPRLIPAIVHLLKSTAGDSEPQYGGLKVLGNVA